MGEVLVSGGSLTAGRISSLSVELIGLGTRTIDRDTALQWLREGHSFLPVRAGQRLSALQLVEVADGDWSIRTDNKAVPEDALPPL